MAAEDRSHQWLIDALYPEERDEQPASPPESEGALENSNGQPLSRSAQQEVAEYRAMLDEVRQGLVTFQPREELRETIRAAARKEAEAIVSQMASEQGPRRAARPRHISTEPSDASFWSRARSQGAIQLIAVLAVCIGAGLLVRAMSQGDAAMEARFEAAPAAVEEEIAFGGDEADRSLAMAPEAEPAEAAEINGLEKTAAKELKNDDFADYDYRGRSQDASTKDDLKLALKQEAPSTRSRQNRRSSSSTKSASKSSSSSWQEEPAPAPSKPMKKSADAAAKADRQYDDYLNDDSGYGIKSEASKDKKASVSKGSLDSLFGGQEDVVQQEAMEEEAAPIVSGKRDALGNSVSDYNYDAPAQEEQQAPSEPLAQEGSAPQTAQKPATTPARDEERKVAEAKPSSVASGGLPGAPGDAAGQGSAVGGANNTTLADAESAYKRNDYEQTIEDADNYLARGIGTNRERARAMELKAEALTALGRGTEARGIYESIREKYPDYYQKENIQQKKKRKAAPKRESTDSADELFQSF